MQDIDETLRRTLNAIGRYDVPERIIRVAADSLTGMPEQVRAGHELDGLADALLDIAEAHDGPHDNCLTCLTVLNGLAVMAAVVRAEVNLAFEQKISG